MSGGLPPMLARPAMPSPRRPLIDAKQAYKVALLLWQADQLEGPPGPAPYPEAFGLTQDQAVAVRRQLARTHRTRANSRAGAVR